MLTVFQCITMEGWTDVLYWVSSLIDTEISEPCFLLNKIHYPDRKQIMFNDTVNKKSW